MLDVIWLLCCKKWSTHVKCWFEWIIPRPISYRAIPWTVANAKTTGGLHCLWFQERAHHKLAARRHPGQAPEYRTNLRTYLPRFGWSTVRARMNVYLYVCMRGDISHLVRMTWVLNILLCNWYCASLTESVTKFYLESWWRMSWFDVKPYLSCRIYHLAIFPA